MSGDGYVYLPTDASKARQREAQNARNNRAEIVKALSVGEITKRDLLRAGIYTAGGTLALKSGLSPYATSAFGQVVTGVPRSPLNGAQKFTTPFARTRVQHPSVLTPQVRGAETVAAFPASMNELPAKRLSYHTDYSNWRGPGPNSGPTSNNPWKNPLTYRGPIEGRPPGEIFGDRQWQYCRGRQRQPGKYGIV